MCLSLLSKPHLWHPQTLLAFPIPKLWPKYCCLLGGRMIYLELRFFVSINHSLINSGNVYWVLQRATTVLGIGTTRKKTCLSALGACVLEEETEGNEHLLYRAINAIIEEKNVLWGALSRRPEVKGSCRGFLGKKVMTSRVKKGEQELV